MKRKGFSSVEFLTAMMIISGVFAAAAAGHLRLIKAFISARNLYSQTINQDEILTKMTEEIKSADEINADSSIMKIQNGTDITVYENLGGELYRNGNLILNENFRFANEGGFVEIQAENLKLKLRCGE